jgi:predicted nucleic acid-binding protein
MPAYLDSSIVLSRLFNQTPQLTQSEWDGIMDPYASELITIETHRVIERIKIQNNYTDEYFADTLAALSKLLSGISIVPLQPRILARATQPFGLAVGTLDALHLSTALLLRDQDPSLAWTFYVHDEQLRRAATANGFPAIG